MMIRMMLKKANSETIQAFIERIISNADEEKAEFIHFNLMQHYLVVRICRGSWACIIWRWSHSEGITVLNYLKAMSGMDAAQSRVLQSGSFSLKCQEGEVKLPAICKPYMNEEQVVLSLLPLLEAKETMP